MSVEERRAVHELQEGGEAREVERGDEEQGSLPVSFSRVSGAPHYLSNRIRLGSRVTIRRA